MLGLWRPASFLSACTRRCSNCICASFHLVEKGPRLLFFLVNDNRSGVCNRILHYLANALSAMRTDVALRLTGGLCTSLTERKSTLGLKRSISHAHTHWRDESCRSYLRFSIHIIELLFNLTWKYHERNFSTNVFFLSPYYCKSWCCWPFSNLSCLCLITASKWIIHPVSCAETRRFFNPKTTPPDLPLGILFAFDMFSGKFAPQVNIRIFLFSQLIGIVKQTDLCIFGVFNLVSKSFSAI